MIFESVVRALALQPDGKILVCGYFLQVNGYSRNSVARLNADGSVDESFSPGSCSAFISFHT
jgi:hypothetical protein